MDFVTAAVSSLDNGLLTLLSDFLNNEFNMAMVTLALIAAASVMFNEQRHLKVLLLTLVLGLGMSVGAKLISYAPRPCEEANAKIPCPPDSSFPSSHTVVAFSLVAASLGYASFALFLPFALFTAFSRVYLGVHTFFDVAASLGLAMLSYALASAILARIGGHGYAGNK
jgi:undecaprenyl-diphosphatase